MSPRLAGHVQNSTVKLHVTKCLSFSVIEILVLYLCPQAKVVCTSVFLISVMLATVHLLLQNALCSS